MNSLTPEQTRILRHMLGIDKPGEAHPKPYRDYYCANPGDERLHELARLGMVRQVDGPWAYEWFVTTAEGRSAALASHRAIMLPKRKRVYRRWLSLSDCLPDLTFYEFLTSAEWAEERRSA